MSSAQQQLPADIEFAVIGGTGVYGVECMTGKQELHINTPFGATSSPIVLGQVGSTRVAFLARHGVDHRMTPSEVPYRANIYALKLLGVKYLLSMSACGSLRAEMAPQHLVLVDQFIDRTRIRSDTFFGNGVVAHVAMGEPVCLNFKGVSEQPVHDSGTYVCMEGPAFSTKAESLMNRNAFGGSVIGMTAVPECKLAREAEMAYCLVAMVTDYDSWHPDHAHVSVDMVMRTLKANGDIAQRVVVEAVKAFSANRPVSEAHSCMRYAVMTSRAHIPDETYKILEPLIGKYVH